MVGVLLIGPGAHTVKQTSPPNIMYVKTGEQACHASEERFNTERSLCGPSRPQCKHEHLNGDKLSCAGTRRTDVTGVRPIMSTWLCGLHLPKQCLASNAP